MHNFNLTFLQKVHRIKCFRKISKNKEAGGLFFLSLWNLTLKNKTNKQKTPINKAEISNRVG